MSCIERLKTSVQRKVKEQVFQEKAFVAFKVSLGTLLSLTPGYYNLWNNPFSLADQCIFTVLGGANLTVGGATEQLLWRFVIGASIGAASFSALNALGGSPIAQGILFFIIVFAQTLYRVKVFKADIGITFATLACVYAVDGSYRSGNKYGVDKEALKDLLRSWAFGAALSLTVNFLVMPIKASSLARNRTSKSLRTIRSITAWLLTQHDAQESEGQAYTPASIRRTLHDQGDTISSLHAESAWEFGWAASDLTQRAEILDAVLQLQRDLMNGARDGPFAVDLPEDLKVVINQAVTLFADWAMSTLDSIILTQKSHKSTSSDLESKSPIDVELGLDALAAWDKAATQVTDAVISTLRSHRPSPQRIAELDRATHCLDAAKTLTDDIARLYKLVKAESHRRRRFQPYLIHTVVQNSKNFLSFNKSGSNPISSSDSSHKSRRSALFITTDTFRFLTSPDVLYSIKVSCALSCLLAILWAPSSRNFFLDFAVRNATVPLLLALMPTVGLSVMSWTGQLGGAILGILYACFAMQVWKGVGRNAYSVPGLFFFEWFLCLAVGHRMLRGPDFLAVTSMNACAIFIVIQWQQTGKPFEQSLALHLGYMLTTSAIAIALAIPFQLLIFPRHARDELRLGHADTLRKLAALALDEVRLSSDVLLSDKSAEEIKSESDRLSGEIAGVKGSLRGQDALVDMAAAEWVSRDDFDANRAHMIVETLHRCADTMVAHIGLCAPGPVDERIRNLLRENNEVAAYGFAEACSTVYWCLGAAWTLSDTPPAPLPSVLEAGDALLREMEQPSTTPPTTPFQTLMHTNDPRLLADIRRWWSLTLTLVTQRSEIASLVEVMSPDWRTKSTKSIIVKRPNADRALTELSEGESSGLKNEAKEVGGLEEEQAVLPVIERER